MVSVLIFIVIFTLLVLSKLHFLWRGFRLNNNGAIYLYRKVPLLPLMVSLDTQSKLNLVLKKETILDRLFKILGISKEYQTGSAEFDNRVYIVSCSEAVCKGVLANSKIKASIQKLIELESMSPVRIRKIVVNNGVVSASFWSFKHPNIKVLAKRIGNHLAVINNELEDLELSKFDMEDPYFYRYIIFTSFINSSFIYAIMMALPISIVNFPWVIGSNELMLDALKLTLITLAILAVFSLKLFINTPYMHLTLLKLLTIGALGVWGVFSVEMYQLNIKGDNQTFHTTVSTVMNKSISASNKGLTYYYIQVESWQEGIEVNNISVSERQYDSVWAGMDVSIIQGGGHLGYPWIKSITSLGYPKKY